MDDDGGTQHPFMTIEEPLLPLHEIPTRSPDRRRTHSRRKSCTARRSRPCVVWATIGLVLAAACATIGFLFIPRVPHYEYAGRSSMKFEGPMEMSHVHVMFQLNLTIHNPNRYDIYFSNTQIVAYAFNGIRLGTSNVPGTLVLRRQRATYMLFETHGDLTLQEALVLTGDCVVNHDFTNVTAKGFVDVHVGPILRVHHSVPPLHVHFPCLLDFNHSLAGLISVGSDGDGDRPPG